jgi:hypothetical protein
MPYQASPKSGSAQSRAKAGLTGADRKARPASAPKMGDVFHRGLGSVGENAGPPAKALAIQIAARLGARLVEEARAL